MHTATHLPYRFTALPGSNKWAVAYIGHASCCLSNAMHGQNINLPVCICLSVCVCVCHNFCQLAYRSDPSTDFYNW